MVKNIFKYRKVEDSIIRPLGAGAAMFFPLFIGLLFHDMKIAQFGCLGAFSYLAFQDRSVIYNLKSTTLHGISLLIAFLLGVGVANIMWVLPFVIALLSFAGYLTVKIYRIPKPSHFFVLMLFATGTNGGDLSFRIIIVSCYLSIGVFSGVLSSIFVSFLRKLPLNNEKENFQRLSLKDKYYVLLYKSPKVWIDAINFSFILFISGYIAYLLRDSFGYWVLISSAAVLSGEEVEPIKHRYLERIFGSIVGLVIGFLLILLFHSVFEVALSLIILNILAEYFMPRNYAIANFFTNPQVLLLSLLTSVLNPTILVLERFSGIVIGSLVAALLIVIMHYALRINNMEY